MAVYAIGDIQGCLQSFRDLLTSLRFAPGRDQLWLTGDLVNRGPDSLGVLRYVRSLEPEPVCVLGNHDLHLLAVASGAEPAKRRDTLQPVLEAADRDELLDWLRHRPLFHYDPHLNWGMVHAGLAPQWDLEQAAALAGEVENVLRGDETDAFFRNMYGDRPDRWSDDLRGWDRLRAIVNGMTRLRYCDESGRMALKAKGVPGTQPRGYLPWFDVPGRASAGLRMVFGHWSTLGRYASPTVIGLDSGCLWGGQLTAAQLDRSDPIFFSVSCPQAQAPARDS
jgi:bis(5'-nucleosyl)-tetraphosphatase (symmetrical)